MKQSIKEIANDILFGYDPYENINKDADGKPIKTKEGKALYFVVLIVLFGFLFYPFI